MIRWRDFQGVALLPCSVLCSVLGIVLLNGCSIFEKTEGVARQVPVKTGQEFVDVYNKNVRKLQNLYINSSVTLDYKKDGKATRDIVDGRVWLSQPNKLALNIKKIDNNLFWLGCDDEKYWMIDLYNKPRVGFVGRHGAEVVSGGEEMVLPATPKELISLFAFSKITLSEEQLAGELEYVDGKYESRGVKGFLIEPVGVNVRYLVDPFTFDPLRIDVLDQEGYSVVVCYLTKHRGFEVKGYDLAVLPRIAGKYDVRAIDRGGRMSLEVSDLTIKKMPQGVFDMGKTFKNFKVQPERIYDLNQKSRDR